MPPSETLAPGHIIPGDELVTTEALDMRAEATTNSTERCESQIKR